MTPAEYLTALATTTFSTQNAIAAFSPTIDAAREALPAVRGDDPAVRTALQQLAPHVADLERQFLCAAAALKRLRRTMEE